METLTAFQSPPRLSLPATPKPSDTTCCVCQETLAAFKTQKVWLSATRRLQEKKTLQVAQTWHKVGSVHMLSGRPGYFTALYSQKDEGRDSVYSLKIHWSATTTQPLTAEMNDIDQLAIAQYFAGTPWTLTFMMDAVWREPYTYTPSQNRRTLVTSVPPAGQWVPPPYRDFSGIHMAPKCPRSKFDWATWNVFMVGWWHDEPPQDPGFPPEYCTVSSLLLSEVLMLWPFRTSFNNPPSCW